MIKDDRWFITEKGIRHLAKLAGVDPDIEVRRWKKELARQNRAQARKDTRLRVLSGETALKPEDAESVVYTTEGNA
jgi:hypothetical protein